MKKRSMFSWGVAGRMNGRNAMKKCIFCSIVYFVVCFGGLGSLYRLVSLLMRESAFAWVPCMFVYHEQHPMQYIGVVAVCYALVAALWTVFMKRRCTGALRILEVLAVILAALVLACPLGGMLWHFHDMLAGFFPNFWVRKLLGGFVDGLMAGPLIIFYSFPYNLIGLIVGYFATSCLNSFFHKMNGEVKGKKVHVMKRRKKSQDYYSLSKQKMIGAAGGIFVAVLGAVPFIVSTISIFVIDYGSNWRRVIVPVFGVILFGACVFYGIRDAVRRWRQISKLQELLGRMTDEERKEFDAAIVQSDVEIYTDETGKPHVASLDH